jgi:predicted acyltransferase
MLLKDTIMQTNRYLSLDVLRGITVTLMIIVNTPGDGSTTFAPLLHAKWHGFTPTDWVFPTFMFVVGNALSFTLARYEALGNAEVLKKIFKRTFLIFLLGYLMYWFPFVTRDEARAVIFAPISHTRIFGVLQRIALGYGLASLIIHFWKLRGAIIFSVVALLGYWAIMYFFGDYSLAGNAGLKLDLFLLGDNHLYHGEGVAFDPEGILSTLPSIVNVIAGYLTGKFIQEKGINYETISKMMLIGAVLLFVALSWDMAFPINKKLWTSSFVLYTVGLDLFVLSIIIYIIEILKIQRWSYFFEVFGKNTLFIYLLSEVGVILLYVFNIGDQSAYEWLFQSVFHPLAGGYMGSLLFAISWMLTCWSVGYWMDERMIYIKV